MSNGSRAAIVRSLLHEASAMRERASALNSSADALRRTAQVLCEHPMWTDVKWIGEVCEICRIPKETT